jgi:DNA ligase-1
MPTSFLRLSLLCKDLESTTKRKEKARLLAEYLTNIDHDEIAPAVLLIIGTVFPEFDSRTLDVGWRTIQKIFDHGGQTSLINRQLTIKHVHSTLQEVSSKTGQGSRRIREQLLEGLVTSMSLIEREFFVRILFGEMRIGVNEGIMLEGIAEASNVSMNSLRRALMITGDIGKVGKIAITQGILGLDTLQIRLFTPMKPMLANMIETVEKAIKEHKGITAFEYKYDGARIQIHKRRHQVRIFSRRLLDVTESLPDIVHLIKDNVSNEDFILEGEVIAIGNNKRPLPFQDLMRRFTRVQKVEEMVMKIPLELHLFDLLYHKGELLIDNPYIERWERLESITENKLLANRITTNSKEEAESFLEKALEEGHEGLMAKRLDSKYSPGSRGKNWLKIKPVETLDVVVVAADWGSGRRKGWLSNYHLGVWNGEEYLIIGKTFKGLTDEEFRWMTKRLNELKESESKYTIQVQPKLVVEIAFNEIQKSPHYQSGYALRFARVKKIRPDKSPKEADTLDKVKELYELQFKHKDRLS